MPNLYALTNALNVANVLRKCTVHYQTYRYVNSVYLPDIFGEWTGVSVSTWPRPEMQKHSFT